MNNQELIDLLFLQSNITTYILAISASILSGLFLDVMLHLYKKYIKKDKDKENE